MNIFRKMVNELKERLKVEVDFKDTGLCLNVDLKPKTEKNKTFYLSIIGEQNLTGGTLITILESDNGNNYLAPAFENDANMFMFLNGLLVPENENDETLLRDLISAVSDENFPDCYVAQEIPMNNGYILKYAYIPEKMHRDFIANDGEFLWNLFISYVKGCVDALLPADRTTTFICNRAVENDSVIYGDLVNLIEQTYPVENLGDIDRNKFHILPECIDYYIYTNIIKMYEKKFSKKLGKTIQDIPLTSDGQIAWYASLVKSTKKEKLDLISDDICIAETSDRD